MKPYRELWWPRFWPFLRVVDEMPSHRINITWRSWWLAGVALLLSPANIGGDGWGILSVFSGLLTGTYISAWIDPIRLFAVPPRKASNYGVSIVIRRDVLRDEPWVLQQEIYESRYWVTHFWRLVDFFWFYKGKPRVVTYIDGVPTKKTRASRWYKAAAHLSRVECASRAQEIRARYEKEPGTKDGLASEGVAPRMWAVGYASDYARSIHGAKNYPQFSAAGWTVDDVYNEIVRNL